MQHSSQLSSIISCERTSSEMLVSRLVALPRANSKVTTGFFGATGFAQASAETGSSSADPKFVFPPDVGFATRDVTSSIEHGSVGASASWEGDAVFSTKPPHDTFDAAHCVERFLVRRSETTLPLAVACTDIDVGVAMLGSLRIGRLRGLASPVIKNSRYASAVLKFSVDFSLIV